MKETNPNKLLYSAFFIEDSLQDWIDRTAGDYLHTIIGKGAESKIIDAAHGLGHRLKTGHDVQGFMEMMNDQGIDGAAKWFQHMFSDLMSPDGIPLPGASHLYRFLEDAGLNVRETFFIDWGCASATDIISGGLSLLILARMHKISTEGKRIKRLASLSIGQVLFVTLAEVNPFFMATIPLQMLLMRHEWKKSQLKRLESRLLISRQRVEETEQLLLRVRKEC